MLEKSQMEKVSEIIDTYLLVESLETCSFLIGGKQKYLFYKMFGIFQLMEILKIEEPAIFEKYCFIKCYTN